MTATATTITLSAPTTGSFAIGDVIQVEDEKMLITGGTGPTWTVVRNWAQDLTVTAPNLGPTHAVGVEVVQARWRGDDLLLGLCAQSGSSSTQMDVSASNLRIETSNTGTLAVIDATDWESDAGGGSGANDTTRYLCSQYQVFWGPYDITEDFFFSGQDGLTPRNASEEWIYNPRFFWSQSRWWEDNQEKDPAYVLPDNASVLSMRELLAKTTILSVNMRAVQDYLTTQLSSALSDRVPGAGPGTQAILGASDYVLRDRVNPEGLLIHVSRYNRYPWNPNLKGDNPWMPGYPLSATTNAGGSARAPNATASGYTNAELAALDNVAPTYVRRTQFATIRGVMNTINSVNNLTSANFPDLMPYSLGASTTAGQLWRTPAIKPQDFHHAVRLTEAADIDWSYGTSNDYASGGLSFVTPNQLFIQGDVNVTPHSVSFGGVTATKANKVGILCDTAIMLSNAWTDSNHRNPGLVMNTTTQLLTGPTPGTLAMNQGVAGNTLPVASSTRYQFALLTHAQPTTRESVRMGESSSFISTILHLENWSGSTMTFVGSIVAMDTRRYSRAYLLDAQKRHGLTPFGWMTAGGNPDSPTAWVSEYSPDGSWPKANTAAWTALNNGANITLSNRWLGSIQGVYGAPTRNLFYNPDFSYKPGQPPLMPFGTTASGMGGWTKIIR
jgi:hypothetical protein